jgi:hypothetical protein
VLLTCAAFEAGRAQSPSSIDQSSPSVLVEPGARVRVTYPARRVREGMVVSSASDGLVVRWTGTAESERVPFSAPIQLEVSRGKGPSHALRRSAIGLIAGLGAGWLVGSFVTTENCHNDTTSPACSNKKDPSYVPFSDHGPAGALTGGVLGAVVGGALGLRRSEMWQRVAVGQTRVGMTLPRGGGVRVGALVSY